MPRSRSSLSTLSTSSARAASYIRARRRSSGPMRWSSRVIWVFSVLALCVGAVRAELPSGYSDRAPEQLARDIFDAEYGRLLVTELGKILRDSADRECLRARAMDTATLEARGHDLLVRNAARFFQIGIDLIDAAKFEAVFAEHA